MTTWAEAMHDGDFAAALALAEAQGDAIGSVLALRALGRRADAESRDADAEAAFARAIALADAGTDALHRAHARLDANVFLSRVNRYPEAVARIREALALVESVHGPGHADTGDVLITLGYRQLEGRPFLPDTLDDAEATLRRAVAILERAPDRVARLATARDYVAAVQRNRDANLVHELRSIDKIQEP
jgi:tetratricopeptide (TPR) repeat protein